MATKPPTAQGISRLLARAGFERSVPGGRGGPSSGFCVGKDYGRAGAVTVTHSFWSMLAPDERYQEMLAQYMKVITAAGYCAEINDREMTVTAKGG